MSQTCSWECFDFNSRDGEICSAPATTTYAGEPYCAMLAVIDLLTHEVRVVDQKREINRKKIRPEKGLPPITYSYRPVIYAPKQVTVVRDRQIEVAQDREKQRREEEARKESERHAKQEALASGNADQAVADEIARLNATHRPRAKHLVPCHIRRVPMSLRHQLDLARAMADGWTPVDKAGREIPFPKDGAYTIVRDHVRGCVEPEVVSRGALTAMLGAMP